jgi:hypothetical protein
MPGFFVRADYRQGSYAGISPPVRARTRGRSVVILGIAELIRDKYEQMPCKWIIETGKVHQ